MKIKKRWKLSVVFYLAFLVIFLQTSSSWAATWYANILRNTSLGARGVQTTTSILDRHPYAENYLCFLDNGLSYDEVFIAWEIGQAAGGTGSFYPYHHIRYANGSRAVAVVYWDYPQASGWHTLKIDARYAGDTHYWNLYCDGKSFGYAWWPYPQNNRANTQVEAYDTDYFFLGRHTNIYLKAGNDVWYLQDSSWSPRIRYGVYPVGSPYYFRVNALYYDWEARK
ncbi:MAG TPA: hypothetical protein ENN38_05645 [Actinobacteria bacterium]|nr:hypothetical protein [Actinomycetota bacterium]